MFGRFEKIQNEGKVGFWKAIKGRIGLVILEVEET